MDVQTVLGLTADRRVQGLDLCSLDEVWRSSCPLFRVPFGLLLSFFFNFQEYQHDTLWLVESNV